MHIFLDESGSFASSQKPGSFSLVCGFVVPEAQLRRCAEVLRRFKIINGFAHDQEVKRRDVTEEAYFALLEALQREQGVVFVVATDAAANTEAEEHKQSQIGNILANEPRMRFPEGKAGVRQFAEAIRSLSTQQWIELSCRLFLIHEVVSRGTLYFVTRCPGTLGAFRWSFDRKDVHRNHFDHTFEELTLPLTQQLFIDDPPMMLQGADYSAFRRFYSAEPYPEWLPKPQIAADREGPMIDTRKLWREHLVFADSATTPGVQLADLMSSGIYGLLRQSFRDNDRAADLLGAMLVQPERGRHALDLIGFGKGPVTTVDPGVAKLIHRMKQSARPMLPQPSPR
jgi:hypothetical protein